LSITGPRIDITVCARCDNLKHLYST